MRFLLQEGTSPPVFVHSRCEDELLAKAELLLFAEDAAQIYPGRAVVASYDVEPEVTIGQIMRGYREDQEGYRQLMEHRGRILSEGWRFPTWEPAS